MTGSAFTRLLHNLRIGILGTHGVERWGHRNPGRGPIRGARALVRLHLEGMHAHSPPGSVFALDFSGLTAVEVTVWSAWQAEAIVGIGALRDLGGGTGELKSMRTHPDFLRRGVAAALLEHIIGMARSRGMTRLSLETGSGAYFEPALALYKRRGFLDGAEFADYKPTSFNRFLHLDL